MTTPQSLTYTGGCHCGAIRFRVTIDLRDRLVECNCSICRKKGYLHLIVPPERFQLLQGEDLLNTYTFNTGVAKHRFCRVCGIHPFYTPRSHPDKIDVNLRCLDEDIQSRFVIQSFDGANWEDNIQQIRSTNRE
jgi:hypothetical protein